MAFKATKKEWGELYILLRMLADGGIYYGRVDGQPDMEHRHVITQIVRQEQPGIRKYRIDEEGISIFSSSSGEEECLENVREEHTISGISRKEILRIAGLILELMRMEEEILESSDQIEEFLDQMGIYDLHTISKKHVNMDLCFGDYGSASVGCNIWSRIGNSFRLLDGGRAANMKLEQSGIKFSNPTVNKINALEASNANDTVKERMFLIERLGGVLKYSEPADRVFRANLAMIDLHLGRLITEMLRIFHVEGISKVTDLTKRMKQINPLKVKTELIEKHLYYEYKIKQLLLIAAFGMRPAKQFTGEEMVPGAIILLNNDGTPVYYPTADRNFFGEFLYRNIRFEKGSTEKDKYGYLEKENGIYYFKLNLKLGFIKR